MTDKGWSERGAQPPDTTGYEGDDVHPFLQHMVRGAHLNRGHEAFLRWPVPGTSHTTDVMFIDGQDRYHAVECVATCEENLARHLRACLIESDAIATVTIVATEKSRLQRIRKTLFADPVLAALSDRVFFEPALKYLEECYA